MINDELPWDGMKVAARVDSLEKQARAFIKARADKDDENYKRDARHFYDDLRAAWRGRLKKWRHLPMSLCGIATTSGEGTLFASAL